MTRKFESLKVLKSEIHDSLQRSRDLNEKLTTLKPEQLSSESAEETLILIGYFLSGIYSIFEEIFVKIAREFENKIEAPSGWHAEMPNRMALEIEDVRPAVLSKESRNCLDELRRFRHVFRFSYAFELNWEKMRFAVNEWRSHSDSIERI